jgi:hypothetical protein
MVADLGYYMYLVAFHPLPLGLAPPLVYPQIELLYLREIRNKNSCSSSRLIFCTKPKQEEQQQQQGEETNPFSGLLHGRSRSLILLRTEDTLHRYYVLTHSLPRAAKTIPLRHKSRLRTTRKIQLPRFLSLSLSLSLLQTIAPRTPRVLRKTRVFLNKKLSVSYPEQQFWHPPQRKRCSQRQFVCLWSFQT